jgi:hypothetical protein
MIVPLSPPDHHLILPPGLFSRLFEVFWQELSIVVELVGSTVVDLDSHLLVLGVVREEEGTIVLSPLFWVGVVARKGFLAPLTLGWVTVGTRSVTWAEGYGA